MDYINANKYSNCLESGDLEYQTESGVVEDDECEGAIVLEQETNRSSSTIGRYFANNLVRAPIFLSFLSMLGSTDGAKTNSLASNHCNLSSTICHMLSTNYSSLVNETISMAFKNFLTAPNSRSRSGKSISPINDTIPISVIVNGSYGRRAIIRQLYSMSEEILDFFNVLVGDDDGTAGTYCAKNSDSFCYKNYHRNISHYELCCPNITSYIRDIIYLTDVSAPTTDLVTNMTTIEPTAIVPVNTTTNSVLTTLGSVLTSLSPVDVTTAVTTASNESNGSLSTLVFVVILFFVGLVLLFVAYMGFRSGRRRGSYHVGGSGEESKPVYMRGGHIEEHFEEDEEESRTVSRPVYVGDAIEEHSI